MMKRMIRNAGKPQGFWGSMMIRKMNRGHSRLTAWGLEQVGFRPGDKVLDIGCGGGKAVARIAAQVPQSQVWGIDYAPLSVKRAKKENQKEIAAGRVTIVEGSVSHLPFGDGVFDVATAIETVYFWPDPPGDLREIRRVLKPGGRLAVVCEMVRQEGVNHTDVENLLNMRVPSVAEVEALMTAAGFVHIGSVLDKGKGWLCMIGRQASDR